MPYADQLIADAFHDGARAFNEQQAEAIRAAGETVPHNLLPVYEPEKRPEIALDGAPPSVRHRLVAPGDETFFGINRPKLEQTIADVRTDLDVSRYAAANRMSAIHEEVVRKADLFFQTGTMTSKQAVDMASREAAAQGLNAIEYQLADGSTRRVNVTTYAEMVLRTSSRRSQMMAEGLKRDQWGEFLVTSPTLHSTCPTCEIWQGKILIDDVFAKGKPDGKHALLSTAIARPSHFLGPNCRHPLVTYFEGVTRIPTASPHDKTRAQYAAEQRQRQIELKLREWKRRAAVAQTDEERQKAYTHVKAWDLRMKAHLRKNPQLRRKPEREVVRVSPTPGRSDGQITA